MDQAGDGASRMERAFERLGIIAPRAWVAHHHLEQRDARVPGDQWPKGSAKGNSNGVPAGQCRVPHHNSPAMTKTTWGL